MTLKVRMQPVRCGMHAVMGPCKYAIALAVLGDQWWVGRTSNVAPDCPDVHSPPISPCVRMSDLSLSRDMTSSSDALGRSMPVDIVSFFCLWLLAGNLVSRGCHCISKTPQLTQLQRIQGTQQIEPNSTASLPVAFAASPAAASRCWLPL